MSRSARSLARGAAISVGIHLALVALLPRSRPEFPRREWVALPERALHVELAVQDALPGVHSGVRNVGAAPLEPGGSSSLDNVDAPDRGEGGDATGARDVILLLPSAAAVTLSDSPQNAKEVGQTSRIETARLRASIENRRATPNPDEQPFVASGQGDHPERRPVATFDPRSGARRAEVASAEGSLATSSGEPRESTTFSSAESGSRSGARDSDEARSVEGGDHLSPGVGIIGGQGRRESERADVAMGRPSVDRARASTTATRVERTSDDTDAELLAVQMVQSVVEATRRHGEHEGEGRGGVTASGAAGIGGGHSEGGRARALGPGRGAFDALDTNDARYVHWYLEMRRRVERTLVFPRERQLAMDQGTSVLRILVRRDGSLAQRPRVIRSSGFFDLDREAFAAVERSAPFGPIPEGLAVGRAALEVTMPIEFSNPMVR